MLAGVTLLENSIILGKKTEITSIGEYLGFIFPVFLGTAALLAVLMIVWGGLEYILSDVSDKKTEAKNKIWGAIWGLVLALAAYLILQTINPAINATELFK